MSKLLAKCALGLFCALSGALPASAQQVVKIGVLNDQAGPFADIGGPGSVVAAKMAAEDFGGKVLGLPIEIIAADHQNKPDIGTSIVKRWFDVDNVGLVVDILHSAVALAVQDEARRRDRIVIGTVIGSPDFTGKRCSPSSIGWTLDTYALSNSLAEHLTKQGMDSWYFITVDYAFGHSLEADAASAVNATGGKILGSVRHPLGSADFSSFLLSAQASRAKAVAFANAGGDLINGMKQAKEFRIGDRQKLVSLDLYITDVHSLGLEAAQGLIFSNAWYWDRDEESRAWAKRFMARHKGVPTEDHASVYSAVMHYLKAIEAAKSVETKAVMEKMREIPVNDMFAKNGRVRVDGRMMHDMNLMRVKSPQESKGPYDYFEHLQVIPAERAFRSLEAGGCPLAKAQ
jgi:branched-chain amino acid transport system substrate-binding protein